MIKNSLADWAGRLGLAYRIGDKMVIRSSYSRFYDAWATTVQLSQNFGGNWPAVNTLDNAGLNVNAPTAPANDPLALGSGGALIYPINDFSQVSQWMVDPNFRTPYMDQWNVGIERELPANSVLDVNYVGSVGRHLDWGPIMNTPPPGPGDVQSRRPYPYMLQQWFDQSVGNSRYNALQVTLNKRTSHGVTFLVAYTLSHTNDDGCGLGANCNSTNPYNRRVDYGTSDTNQKNAFSAAFTLQSPFDQIFQQVGLQSGWRMGAQWHWPDRFGVALHRNRQRRPGERWLHQPGTCGPGRLANSGPGLHTPAQWFNVNAFALQAPYTYGNEKVNPLTSDGTKNLDLSLFRTFHVGLGESRYFEFRAESFNLFNRVMFAIPNAALGGANFGAVTQPAEFTASVAAGPEVHLLARV